MSKYAGTSLVCTEYGSDTSRGLPMSIVYGWSSLTQSQT